MPTKLFVGNVSDSTTEDDLRVAFEKYGPVTEVSIIRNYAFVHYEKKEDAETAIKELHETTLKGNEIRVLMSTTPHKNGSGRSGRGRGPPYPRERDRRGPPRWDYGPPPSDRRYHPYDRDYRGSYSYGGRGYGGYGYQTPYDTDYSRDYSRDYPPRSYPPSSSSYYASDYRYGGSERPVTYPDVKRQPSSWDR